VGRRDRPALPLVTSTDLLRPVWDPQSVCACVRLRALLPGRHAGRIRLDRALAAQRDHGRQIERGPGLPAGDTPGLHRIAGRRTAGTAGRGALPGADLDDLFSGRVLDRTSALQKPGEEIGGMI